jgi:hypothetical protein
MQSMKIYGYGHFFLSEFIIPGVICRYQKVRLIHFEKGFFGINILDAHRLNSERLSSRKSEFCIQEILQKAHLSYLMRQVCNAHTF